MYIYIWSIKGFGESLFGTVKGFSLGTTIKSFSSLRLEVIFRTMENPKGKEQDEKCRNRGLYTGGMQGFVNWPT